MRVTPYTTLALPVPPAPCNKYSMLPDDFLPDDVTLTERPADGTPPPLTPGPKEAIPGGFLNPPAVAGHYKDAAGNYVPPPEGVSYGDWMLKPGRPLRARHKKLAQLIALDKQTGEIAEILGYTEARVSVLRSNTQIQQEADRFRDKLFERAIGEHMKDLAPDAMSVIEEMITSDAEKLKDRVEAAKWLVEMVGGKAKQQLTHEAGSSISDLLNRLGQLSAGTPQEARTVLELERPKEPDWMDNWVAEQKAVK